MKVLYISNYSEISGYSQAATDYILALDRVGVDVVCRPLIITGRRKKPCQRIVELENKSSMGCDIVIQHTLPHMMHFNGDFKKNIAIYASETDSIKHTVWPKRLNCMDEVWVINNQMKDAAKSSGVNKPIQVVPHTNDSCLFEQSYDPIQELKVLKDDGKFLFYFIGEPIRRKNLSALIKAFHLEFDRLEPVELIIKTSGNQEEAVQYCEKVRASLKLGQKLKSEFLITKQLSDQEMLRLHNSCDCLVAPSFGEAWHIPAATAMGFGKTPIVTGWSGFPDYLSDNEGWLVDYRLEPVCGVMDGFQDLYTGRELWASIDVIHLRNCMRQCYENRTLRKQKSLNGIKRSYDFSYESVGNLMKGLLDGTKIQGDKNL